MLNQTDIVEVSLTTQELMWAAKFAHEAEIGGHSQFRESQERASLLSIDQFVGVGLGELVGNKYFFSFDHYLRSRRFKNENPHVGDAGCDTLGYRIDYKASQILLRKPNPLDYTLAVRPLERHEGHIYVLVMADVHELKTVSTLVKLHQPKVYLIGWATDEEVGIAKQAKSGVFGPKNNKGGAFVIPATELNPIRKLTVGMIKRVSS